MQLNLDPNQLHIALEWYERLWAFYLSKTIDIPLSHIIRATTEKPIQDWTEIRAPGTCLPGVIKAGTYYTRSGRQFWYVTQTQKYLTLELKEEYYSKIILTLADNETWANQINQVIAAT